MAYVDDHVLSVSIRSIDEPRSSGEFMSQPRAVPRRRLVAGGVAGKPDSALAGRGQVPWRDAEMRNVAATRMAILNHDGLGGMIGGHDHSGARCAQEGNNC